MENTQNIIWENADVTHEVVTTFTKYTNKTFFKTRLNFLGQINGLRPQKFHLVIGTAGGGKSTLLRTILLDMVEILKTQKGIALAF